MNKTAITYILLVIVVIGGLIWLMTKPAKAGALDAFTTCVANSGAKFYGAFWCPHCQNQKKLFGASVKLLPYIECSNPDGQGQNAICNSQGIQGYPTWVWPDNSTSTGEESLATISQKTSCVLPAGY